MEKGYVIVDVQTGLAFNPFSKKFEKKLSNAHVYRQEERYRRGFRCIVPSRAAERAHDRLCAAHEGREIELHSMDSLQRLMQTFRVFDELEISL